MRFHVTRVGGAAVALADKGAIIGKRGKLKTKFKKNVKSFPAIQTFSEFLAAQLQVLVALAQFLVARVKGVGLGQLGQ